MKLSRYSWFFFIREFPRQTFTMLLCLLLAGAADSVGAFSILPLMGGLLGQEPTQSALTAKLTMLFEAVGMPATLGNLLLVFCAAMVCKAALSLLAYKQTGYVEAEVTTQLRSSLLDNLLKAKWSYYVSQPVGPLAYALSTECAQAGVALRVICQALSHFIQAASYLWVALFISWQLVLGAIVASVLFFVLFRLLINAVRRAGVRQVEAVNAMVAFFTDALAGVKPLKVMGVEELFMRCIRSLSDKYKDAARQHAFSFGLLVSTQEPLLVILLAIGLYVSRHVASFDIAVIFTMAIFFHRILTRVMSTQQSLQQYALQESQLHSLLGKIDTIREHRQSSSRGASVRFSRMIELCNVSFQYGDTIVLDNFSMSIPFQAITAIKGHSGAGKSTITDLVTGLISAQSGDVHIDGVPLADIDIQQWRSQIGYVPQEVFLFNDTIRNNLLIGRDYPDHVLWEALAKAGAKMFVESCPAGLDTEVGEQGRSFSGGQRQRLMIARALISNPRLLILDEATSGLDQATQAELLTTILELKQHMAILAITHSDALVAASDRLHHVGEGKQNPTHRSGDIGV